MSHSELCTDFDWYFSASQWSPQNEYTRASTQPFPAKKNVCYWNARLSHHCISRGDVVQLQLAETFETKTKMGTSDIKKRSNGRGKCRLNLAFRQNLWAHQKQFPCHTIRCLGTNFGFSLTGNGNLHSTANSKKQALHCQVLKHKTQHMYSSLSPLQMRLELFWRYSTLPDIPLLGNIKWWK